MSLALILALPVVVNEELVRLVIPVLPAIEEEELVRLLLVIIEVCPCTVELLGAVLAVLL
jgi:hypothetical protein